MAMHRSWIVWLTSTAAFCVTVALIIVTGPDHGARNKANAQLSASDGNVQLPQINAHAQGYAASIVSAANAKAAEAERPPVSGLSAHSSDPSVNRRPAASQSADPSANQQVEPYVEPASEPASIAQPSIAQSVVGLSYQPREIVQLAHPSNYGDRYERDINNNPADNDYIVVLHETVGSASSALNTFQTNHTRDEDQVSYHTLIGLDGTIYYVVPPEQRAFGAGNSAFQSYLGEEAVFTNAEFPSSVNNFAYHISLETPLDGQNSAAQYHSGYTESQYQSLAWLLARTNIPDDRITTHRSVDRSRSRIDPRSFEADRMFRLLRQYPRRQQAG